MASSRQFVWVTVNRDRTPDIPKQYAVSAYPTLLTVGPNNEKIHRFQSFQKPPEFLASLNASLRRWGLYKNGEPWDEPAPRAASIFDSGTVEALPAPSEAAPSGICVMGERAWVAQDTKLWPVDPVTGDRGKPHVLEDRCVDLTTDGTRLFAVPYGWSKGDPIVVIDPKSGEVLRRIVTASNKKNRAHSTRGVAWDGSHLWVLSGMSGRVDRVDPTTGGITRTVDLAGKRLAGMDFDGEHLICGGPDAVTWFDPATGAVVRRVEANYPIRLLAASGDVLLLMEQPVFGHDVGHRRIRVWPKRTIIHRWTPPPRP